MKIRLWPMGLLFLLVAVTLSGCGKQEEELSAKPAVKVKTQKVADSRQAITRLEYPALIVAESQAKIIAKSSGNAVNVRFKMGDRVKIGQELLKIDEVGGNGFSSGFNATQVKQAALAVNQAQAAYELAKKNYDNLVVTGAKDLKQAEIAKDQAYSAKNNQVISAADAVKAAEIAYKTAQTAAAQAWENLENRRKQLNQSGGDTDLNTANGADAAVAACGTIITATNNGAALDEKNLISLPYGDNLGALDSSTLLASRNSYQAAKQAYENYLSAKSTDSASKIGAAIDVAAKTKKLAENYKRLLDKTIVSSNLPAENLAALQTAAAGYLNQANGAVSQATALQQGLSGFGLNSETVLDGLTRAYELAKFQEEQAAQTLNNLKNGNQAGADQVNFAYAGASNNYENLKVKINTQLINAKTQLDLAQLQYSNAQVALQGLYDSRLAIAPIDGFISQKNINEGEAVSVGQVLAVISRSQDSRVEFYVDSEAVGLISLGMKIMVTVGDRQTEASITAIAPQADEFSKRFLVEAKPAVNDLTLGSIGTALIEIVKRSANEQSMILPLSAIAIGQNANHIFIVDGDRAKQVAVTVGAISGEFAEIKAELTAEQLIIIEGARLLKDGQQISLQ